MRGASAAGAAFESGFQLCPRVGAAVSACFRKLKIASMLPSRSFATTAQSAPTTEALNAPVVSHATQGFIDIPRPNIGHRKPILY